jgi:hemerythrin superfamily protein
MKRNAMTSTPTPNGPPSPPKKSPGSGKADEQDSQTATAADPKKDAIDLLKADHREVEQLFKQFESSTGRQQRKKLIEKIAAALTAHTIIEEEIFYPACRDKDVDHDELDEAQVEHDTVKLLVADLLKSSQDDDYYQAKVTVLSEYVKHHVGEEEDPSDGIFARAKSAQLDMAQLGEKLQARKDKLMSDEKRLIGRPPKIRSLDLSQLTKEYGDMSRYPTDRYRDEEGRNGGYRSSANEPRGGEYRRDYDEDFGPNRGAYGNADHDRSTRFYPEDDQSGYLGGTGNSERGYSENTRSSQRYADPAARPGQHRLEQSGSGGRYRLDYEQDDNDHRPGAGRNTGSGEDREYYQGTRYGSTYGGGRYRTENEGTQGHNSQDRDDRYYSGRGAYGAPNEWEEGQRRHDLGGRDDIGRRDFGGRDDNNGRPGPGGKYRASGGFRGVR